METFELGQAVEFRQYNPHMPPWVRGIVVWLTETHVGVHSYNRAYPVAIQAISVRPRTT